MRSTRAQLSKRMGRAQRHRLLQGYPMAPLMPVSTAGRQTGLDLQRPTIVGVLPHPFCNPRVKGCGFCTFSHEKHSNERARDVVKRVVCELEGGRLRGRDVQAVYIGGGTANLTPPDAFSALLSALGREITSSPSEITLEGVPAYFLGRDAALLRALADSPWAPRISMGVQTFDPEWLRRMGRSGFGDRHTVERVVALAGSLGAATSGDFLVNLPGQPVDAMLDDVRIAVESGLDQICIYHLVLFEGIGTEWSRDPAMLSARPANEVACESWLRVREYLLERGFVQTTLTNFERPEAHASARRFRYEEHSFAPWAYDAIGFGPGAISTFGAAHKRLNVAAADDYVRALDAGLDPVARAFDYTPVDRDLLFLTRGLSRTEVDLCHLGDPDRFAPTLGACEDAGLLVHHGSVVRLTPRGMFYADSVTGLLAAERAEELAPREKRHLPVNDARHSPMG